MQVPIVSVTCKVWLKELFQIIKKHQWLVIIYNKY